MGIRKIMDDIAGKENPNKKIISLAQGDPTAYPHLRPGKSMVESLCSTVTGGGANGYQPSQGNGACRQAIAEYFSVPCRAPLKPNDVFMTLGCSEALHHCIAALAHEGANILLPRPGFCLYEVLCNYQGVEPRYYDLLPDQKWEIDVPGIKKLVDANTIGILINNPSNPCGAVFSKDHLTKVLAAAEELKLPVIADEVYTAMSFDVPYMQCAAVSATVPVMSVCALSKRWLAPGWRVGWLTVHDADGVLAKAGVQETLLKLCQISLGPTAPIQAAIPGILKNTPQEWYDGMMKCFEASAKTSLSRGRSIPGLEIVSEPQGAMYMMVRLKPGALRDIDVDDVKFSGELLREESIAVLPGKCFNAPGYFRTVFAAPPEVLNQAWDRIEEFCKRRLVA